MGVVLAPADRTRSRRPHAANDTTTEHPVNRKNTIGLGASGFSLIETLIGMAILAIVLVGLVPLFAKSMTNNVEASQLTEVTARARLRMEELLSMPFNAQELTVPNGQNELLVTEQYSAVDERWYEDTSFPAGQTPLYTRVTRVRQFPVSAITDGDLELDVSEALAGGSPPSTVHFKEIEVKVNSGPATNLYLLGQRKAITLRVLKSS